MRTWRARRRPDTATVAGSALFDRDWYLQRYPDVAASGQDPAAHYARFGAIEGRDPGPAFSTAGYAMANPDVAAAGANPLVHYELHGRTEGRSFHPPTLPPLPRTRQDIVFVSGEPGTPGHVYRVARPAAAATTAGLRSLALTLTEAASDPTALDAAVVVIWRAAWDARVESVMQAARQDGARIVFDVDDLMFEPDLATFAMIDGIRTQSLTEPVVADFYRRVQQTLLAADAVMSPTAFLTARMQRFGKPGFVIPNGFDDTTATISAAARAARGETDGLVQRIGYAGGTRTHQKDFAVVAEPVAAALRADAHRRLVLFRRGAEPCVDIAEFPALHGLEAQIEWRQMVGLMELPWELARFDVNLAPLEVGNPYCEAKSELKFFEAALVGVPTIASPTQPFRDAISDGETGYLANDNAEWLGHITTLLTDRTLSHRMAQAASVYAEAHYGAQARGAAIMALFQQCH